MSRTCIDCAKPISRKSKSGRCVRCACIALNELRRVPRGRCLDCGTTTSKPTVARCRSCDDAERQRVRLAAHRECADCQEPIDRRYTRCSTCAGNARRGHVVAQGCRAAASSEALRDRITDLYRATAARRGCSVDAARLALNYSPAQLARMAA